MNAFNAIERKIDRKVEREEKKYKRCTKIPSLSDSLSIMQKSRSTSTAITRYPVFTTDVTAIWHQ